MNNRVLVIDDELAVRQAFEIGLAQTGYSVTTASNGIEGIARARDVKPDLIFLDLRMPGIDGVETLRRLRTDFPSTPPYIYIVTAFRPEFLGQLATAAKNGLDFQVVDKPITEQQIEALARSVLEGLRAL